MALDEDISLKQGYLRSRETLGLLLSAAKTLKAFLNQFDVCTLLLARTQVKHVPAQDCLFPDELGF